jgi:hypothetical protein
MLFRGKFLHDGEIVIRRADIELQRTIQDGAEIWKGSFIGPLKKLLAGKTYQLVLDNGRSADTQLDPERNDAWGPERINFTVFGGFRLSTESSAVLNSNLTKSRKSVE